MQTVGVVHPNVCVPHFAVRVGFPVGLHACAGNLVEHDRHPTPPHHAEARRLSPEALILKAKLVAVVVGGRDHIVDQEERCRVPAGLTCILLRHLSPFSTSIHPASGSSSTSFCIEIGSIKS